MAASGWVWGRKHKFADQFFHIKLTPKPNITISPPARTASRGIYQKWSWKNFTHQNREWICCYSVTLWPCGSVTLWKINGLISLPPYSQLGQKKFAFIWAKNYVSKNFSGKGQVPEKHWFVKLSHPFDKVLVWKFKLKLKIEKLN